MSNFDWTDKKTVRWFVLLPTGHEGPYSLQTLEIRTFSRDVKIWCEGLSLPVSLGEAIINANKTVPVPVLEDEMPPPLPPLPTEEDLVEPEKLGLAEQEEVAPSVEIVELKNALPVWKVWGGVVFGLSLLSLLLVSQWIKSFEKFSILRRAKMSPALQQRIETEIKFEGWNKKIFFKEFVPPDLSLIWFVSAGFQECEVEAIFQSSPGKLLSQEEEKVSFLTKTRLVGHIAEFTKFEFKEGIKIIPGLYDVDIKAHSCRWDGVVPNLANKFSGPDSSYQATMKVILYPGGAKEFNARLDKLIQFKLAEQVKAENQEKLFWDSLQQKLQTLLSISLQIEQSFIDLFDSSPKDWDKTRDTFIQRYTKQFGHLLTQFVVDNDEDGKNLESNGLDNIPHKRDQLSMIKMISKSIGHESMKMIETIQKQKAPSKKEMLVKKAQILKTFKNLKAGIEQRLIQVTEDRSM